MFTLIRIERLSVGSIFKLIAIGMGCSFVPLCVFFGILAAFGAQTVTWNGQHLTGVSGLLVSPLIGLMVSGIGAVLLGSACAFGLWVYSLVRPMSILVKEAAAHDAI